MSRQLEKVWDGLVAGRGTAKQAGRDTIYGDVIRDSVWIGTLVRYTGSIKDVVKRIEDGKRRVEDATADFMEKAGTSPKALLFKPDGPTEVLASSMPSQWAVVAIELKPTVRMDEDDWIYVEEDLFVGIADQVGLEGLLK